MILPKPPFRRRHVGGYVCAKLEQALLLLFPWGTRRGKIEIHQRTYAWMEKARVDNDENRKMSRVWDPDSPLWSENRGERRMENVNNKKNNVSELRISVELRGRVHVCTVEPAITLVTVCTRAISRDVREPNSLRYKSNVSSTRERNIISTWEFYDKNRCRSL